MAVILACPAVAGGGTVENAVAPSVVNAKIHVFEAVVIGAKGVVFVVSSFALGVEGVGHVNVCAFYFYVYRVSVCAATVLAREDLNIGYILQRTGVWTLKVGVYDIGPGNKIANATGVAHIVWPTEVNLFAIKYFLVWAEVCAELCDGYFAR